MHLGLNTLWNWWYYCGLEMDYLMKRNLNCGGSEVKVGESSSPAEREEGVERTVRQLWKH